MSHFTSLTLDEAELRMIRTSLSDRAEGMRWRLTNIPDEAGKGNAYTELTALDGLIGKVDRIMAREDRTCHIARPHRTDTRGRSGGSSR